MSVVPGSIVCDRVRAQISLRLDGELSQLESRMLESHLARCAECSMYDTRVGAVTAELRAAPLESLEHPIVIRRPRRQVSLARVQIGVAAALAVAVLGAISQIGAPGTEPALVSPDRYATYTQLTREVEQIIADGRAFSQRRGDALPL
ncbi:MAG: zf-HC2 domain-containing protein [Actinobacteria bacterium]|nr:zf-HC2 domain-containing protein [Actinomycetota bacterium]